MTSSSGKSVVFRVERCLCAIPLESVVETMRPLPIERLATPPEFVLGVAIVRGAPLPVVDLGRLLGGQDARPTRFMIVRTGSKQIALTVGDVLGVHRIPVESLQELPSLLRNAGSDAVSSIGALDSELLFVLRATRILPDAVLETVASDAEVP